MLRDLPPFAHPLVRHAEKCRNHLRVGVRSKNAGVSGLRVGPSKHRFWQVLAESALALFKSPSGGGLTCDLAGLLQNGKWAHNQKWPEKWPAKWPAAIFRGGSEMAEKWPGKWLDSQKSAKFFHFSAIFRPFRNPPRKMAAGHLAGPFSGHFWLWAHFPFCSRPAKSQGLTKMGSVTF